MTGKVRITYAIHRSHTNEMKSITASLEYGGGFKSYIHATAPTKEEAKAKVIQQFKEIPEPETIDITD